MKRVARGPCLAPGSGLGAHPHPRRSGAADPAGHPAAPRAPGPEPRTRLQPATPRRSGAADPADPVGHPAAPELQGWVLRPKGTGGDFRGIGVTINWLNLHHVYVVFHAAYRLEGQVVIGSEILETRVPLKQGALLPLLF